MLDTNKKNKEISEIKEESEIPHSSLSKIGAVPSSFLGDKENNLQNVLKQIQEKDHEIKEIDSKIKLIQEFIKIKDHN